WGYRFDVFRDTHFDRSVVYEFHAYWAEPKPEIFEAHLQFSQQHDVPIFLGKWGRTPTNGSRASGARSTSTRSAGRSGPISAWTRQEACEASPSRLIGTISSPIRL